MDRSIQNSEISNIFSSKTALSKFAYSDLMVYVISCDIPTLSMPCLRAIYIYIYIYIYECLFKINEVMKKIYLNSQMFFNDHSAIYDLFDGITSSSKACFFF